MSYSLSAPLRRIPSSTSRQRAVLLMVSVALHAVVLIPIALNTVFIPTFDDETPFEVWLEMQPRPVPELQEPRVQPKRPLPVPVDQTEQPEAVEPKPSEQQQRPVPEQQREQLQQIVPQTPLEQANRAIPHLQQAREQQSLDSNPADSTQALNSTALPNLAPSISRPVIEDIDGPQSATQSLSPSRSLPSLAPTQDNATGSEGQSSTADSQTGTESLDTPIPRRARIDEEGEAALAAAAAGGALDDAWTYRPEQGGGQPSGGGASGAGSTSGVGGVAGNTATQGRVYYGRSTPLDCTQPQMLSDLQRLSCDSADARRIRESMERGRRVTGTGNAERDARNSAEGNRQLDNYERRRAPLAGGVGVSQGSIQGGSGRGEELDALSGTNREIQKLQSQIGASNGPRAPAPPASTTPND